MAERTLSFAGQQIRIQYPEDTQDTIEFLFRNVPLGNGADHALIHAVGSCCTEAFTLLRDGEQIGHAQNEAEMANLLMGESIYSLIDGISQGIALHSGAVARNGKGVWLPGNTGAGKSTLVAWLLSRGFDYLTDELVYARENEQRFESFTRSLNIKQTGRSAIETILDLGSRETQLLETDSVLMIPYELFGAKLPRVAPELSLIVFPSFEDGAQLLLETLTPARSGLHLMGCHVNARNLDDHGFHEIATLAKQVPACKLRYGNLEQLEGVVDELIEMSIDWDLDRQRFEKLVKTIMAGKTSRQFVGAEAAEPAGEKVFPIPEATPAGKKKRLTIGMATYDDFDGAYFSVQAIRMYHPEVLDDTEILVVDNHPDGRCAQSLKKLDSSVQNYRYLPFDGFNSTVVKDLVFREANADYVLCIDSHVLIVPGALRKLIDYFDNTPNCRDLLQGPMLYDNLKNYSTHFKPQWSGGMYGTWDIDARGESPEGEPFEIPMQGCGLFACRKDAWPGFNLKFRGFGGEEWYIHEKFRQRGGKTLCLPFLRWLHRFDRPMGVPYEVKWDDRIRNYLLGFKELGIDPKPVEEHFKKHLGKEQAKDIFERVRLDIV